MRLFEQSDSIDFEFSVDNLFFQCLFHGYFHLRMEPNYLKVKELHYELNIHKIKPTGNVDVKRELFRGALCQESANRNYTQGVMIKISFG